MQHARKEKRFYLSCSNHTLTHKLHTHTRISKCTRTNQSRLNLAKEREEAQLSRERRELNFEGKTGSEFRRFLRTHAKSIRYDYTFIFLQQLVFFYFLFTHYSYKMVAGKQN